MGGCKILIVSLKELVVALKTSKNYNLIIWRDDSKNFNSEFENGLKR
jgi:hypothetical protein